MAGSLLLKNDVQLVTQLPQSRRQVHDVPSAAESVRPISDSEVTRGPMTRPATLSSSATSSSYSTDFSSSSRHQPAQRTVLGQIDCFVQGEVVGSQIALDGVQPCDTRTPWWSIPVI